MPVTQDAALRSALQELARGASLSAEDAAAAFGVVMRGDATPSQIAGLLIGLRSKGETAEEIAGAAVALRSAMVRLEVEDAGSLVDTCGTGGGKVGTLNLSTAAAFVVAGAGIGVAKHGNRSYTSRSGSADVLEALGIDIELSPDRAAEVLRRAGIVFLFAPAYHPAMRHVSQVRKELGVATIMNVLGPLVNPAGVVRQVVGVADESRGPLVAGALQHLGATHAIVVHARVGMDEVSPSGVTDAWEVERECDGAGDRSGDARSGLRRAGRPGRRNTGRKRDPDRGAAGWAGKGGGAVRGDPERRDGALRIGTGMVVRGVGGASA